MSKYAGTKTEQNLMEAFAGESQARNKYTYYASPFSVVVLGNFRRFFLLFFRFFFRPSIFPLFTTNF